MKPISSEDEGSMYKHIIELSNKFYRLAHHVILNFYDICFDWYQYHSWTTLDEVGHSLIFDISLHEWVL
jgi:hypothetical protein